MADICDQTQCDLDLEAEELSKLFAKAEEILALVIEYDPVEERRIKVCSAIRLSFECYTQMHKEISFSIREKTAKKTKNCSIFPIHKVKITKKSNLPKSNLEVNKLMILLENIEEFLSMIVESDPFVERSIKVCTAVRFAIECYTQMESEFSCSLKNAFTKEVQNHCISPNTKEQEYNSLLDNSDYSGTSDCSSENDKSNENVKIKEIIVIKGKSKIKVEEKEEGTDDDNSLLYDYLDGEITIKTEEAESIINEEVNAAFNFMKANVHASTFEKHFGKKLQCTLCDYKTPSKYSLRVHLAAVHYKIKQFKCKVCPYESARKANLDKHILAVHDKLKPHKCLYCSLEFSLPDRLKHHIRSVHGKIKPHKCSICDYSASRRRDILRHITSIHEKDKKFKCSFCDFKCNRKDSLKCHMKCKHEVY